MAQLFKMGLENIDLWRSEEMQLVQLIVPSDSAHDTVAALGDLGLLQFRDLNTEKSAFQRSYANQVKRGDEMARRLRFLNEQVEKEGLPIAHRSVFGRAYTMDELEVQLEELESEILQINSNSERLQRTRAELTELQMLLEHGGKFFDSARQQAVKDTSAVSATSTAASTDFSAPLLADREAPASYLDPKVGRLGFVAGLIAQEKLAPFERLLFRATRGNMLLRTDPIGRIQDPASGETQEKSVFVVFSSGDRARAKINKICEAFGANRYPFPEEGVRQRQASAEVDGRLSELSATISAGDAHRLGVLRMLAANLDSWITLVRREKAIYHTLNKLSMDTSRKVLVGEAWVPSGARAHVADVLRQAALASFDADVSAVLQPLGVTHESPPTYFSTNKFTDSFQAIVDAYGTARYREVNPTVFTIMTFPFLFAVMFGDFGHGLLLLAFALALVLNERKLGKAQLDDMTAMAYSGRYVILLMSLYSIYTGLLYNEFFSIPMAWFGDTHFKCTDTSITDLRDCKVGAMQGPDGPYPFGVDPTWRGGKKELPYLNSLKMKMSIVMGVTHMNLGIIMSWLNNLFFRDTLSTLAEFVPQMIFLNSLFGYLSVLIVMKWVKGSLADLYHVMIMMFLNPGVVDDAGYMFDGQAGFQVFLVLIAITAVPFMLFLKPMVLNARYKAALAGNPQYASLAHGGGHGDHGGQFNYSEVMVHQIIHTIEFVLGAVSNTASYLRLWALSLAHSQLSAVFYDRVLMFTIQMNSKPAMVVGFFVWFMATLGVLMVMESLSAFLHALRLHWVEFQGKFYRGDGYKFAPFSLKKAEEAADE